jgi:transposase
VLQAALRARRFEFPVERAVFAAVLHRLVEPGSDRQALRWLEESGLTGAGELELHHFYRAMAWLGEELPAEEQSGATPFAPRCTKDLIEEALFARRRDLFSGLDLVFFDTTSIYFEGEGGETLGRHGHSKDHRPDLRQMVVGAVLDGKGNPVCAELWPGNTTDVKTLLPVAARLKERFGIGRVALVADRGMISEETVRELDRLGWLYVLGARMRRCREVRDEVLGRAGRSQEVFPERQASKDPAPLKVKEVKVGGRRYIVCLNEEEARKDRHDREAILESLRQALKQGDKALVGNRGYRRYLKGPDGHFSIDESKIAEEARYDGKWVLLTNTDLTAAESALKYKGLWMVEDIFRSAKTLLATRPVVHKCDQTIRGHVWCSFLALVLRKELQDRLEALGGKDGQAVPEWADVVRDLDALGQTELRAGGKRYLIRTDAGNAAVRAFAACGLALPPRIRQL